MLGRSNKIILGLIGTVLVSVFVIGLANSISTGFAGFWGGLPFWVIVIFVLSLAVTDYVQECVLDKDGKDKNG
ncbi:hypothetical protein [Roseibium aggregatum]|uniref:Uncharacterized protein n=1 Tax=Roseibium aggregatum TaxID=187304 RepID=A0A926NZH5_9HYPH|nr:hypothetical protein [Roseibium aggregatum]MBD1546148.1 hypothetical protein [Roseibium aggregatum]